MAKGKVESSCPCWNCMAKSHVKESQLVKLVLQPAHVKAILLNLKNSKDKKRKQKQGRCHQEESVDNR